MAEVAFRPTSANFYGASASKSAALLFLALALSSCRDAPHPASRWAIGAAATQIRCVNTASRAAWNIALDATRRLADGHTASFRGRRTSWRNTSDGSAFELDRATGALLVTRASSTGGYVSTYVCAGA